MEPSSRGVPLGRDRAGKKAEEAQKLIFPECCVTLGKSLQLSGPPFSWQSRTDYCPASTSGRGQPPDLEHQRVSRRLPMTGDGPGSRPGGLWESLWAEPFPLPALSFLLGKMGRGRLTWTTVRSPWFWDVWSAVHRHYCLTRAT